MHRLSFLFLLILLAGCPQAEPPTAPSGSAVATPEPSPEVPRCDLRGQVLEDDGPVGGISFVITVRERIDERRWRTLERIEGAADVDGRFSQSVPCGAELSLDLAGWVWANPVPDLRALPEGPELIVQAYGKIRAQLFAADAGGRRAGHFVRARDGRRLELPLEGLELRGLEMSKVAGTVEVEGHAPRTWRPDRSDVWDEHEPGHAEASVLFGDLAARWVVPAAAVKGQVRGLWCLDGAARGEACKRTPSAWRCGCTERVGVASDRWDTVWILDLAGVETELAALPEAIEACGDPAAHLRPAGIDGGSLFQAMLPPAKPCAKVPAGQPIEVGSAGSWAPL